MHYNFYIFCKKIVFKICANGMTKFQMVGLVFWAKSCVVIMGHDCLAHENFDKYVDINSAHLFWCRVSLQYKFHITLFWGFQDSFVTSYLFGTISKFFFVPQMMIKKQTLETIFFFISEASTVFISTLWTQSAYTHKPITLEPWDQIHALILLLQEFGKNELYGRPAIAVSRLQRVKIVSG